MDLQVFIKLSNQQNKWNQVIQKPMVIGYNKIKNTITAFMYTWGQKKKKSEIDWWSRIKLGNRLRCNKDKMTLQITGKEWAIQEIALIFSTINNYILPYNMQLIPNIFNSK